MDKINHTLYRCQVNPRLKISYLYKKIVRERYGTINVYKDTIYINPSFMLSIDEGVNSSNRVSILSSNYYSFVMLFHKSLKQIQKYIHDLFPGINKTEFEVDRLALQRFMTEKAMSSAGYTIIPSVWVNDTNESYPALDINSLNHGICRIPIEDALAIDQMFSTFDPNTFGFLMLGMLGYN